jgi:hypothetical protein
MRVPFACAGIGSGEHHEQFVGAASATPAIAA